MRIALDQSSEVGFRAGRILLGDRRVTVLGLLGRDPRDTEEPKLIRVDELAGFDALVTDAEDPLGAVTRADDEGVDCVTWVEIDAVDGGNGIAVLSGANLSNGIAPCLASHEVARAGAVDDIQYAWTEPGSPLSSGEGLAFPDPVGGRWGRRVNSTSFVAPVAGEWAGAMARVVSSGANGRTTRIVGVSDLAPHLEALALAAGALATVGGAYPPGGLRQPSDAAEAFLAEALGLGLDVAAYTLEG